MLILASQSPRRAALLRQVGIAFQIAPADIDETAATGESAVDYVRRMALEKAIAVRATYPDSPVLGADTAVVLGEQILGKPSCEAAAVDMLMALSGQTHSVLTGVALAGPHNACRLSQSRVTFATISRDQARAYWQTGEPRDKAGSYAVQGLGAAFIERIEGSYSGIMGLPLFETLALLRTINVRCVIDV